VLAQKVETFIGTQPSLGAAPESVFWARRSTPCCHQAEVFQEGKEVHRQLPFEEHLAVALQA